VSEEIPEVSEEEEALVEEPAIEDEPAVVVDEASSDDRLFSIVAIGLMVLLLICVALALIADRRPPAGL
jgi:hypothetical protein